MDFVFRPFYTSKCLVSGQTKELGWILPTDHRKSRSERWKNSKSNGRPFDQMCVWKIFEIKYEMELEIFSSKTDLYQRKGYSKRPLVRVFRSREGRIICGRLDREPRYVFYFYFFKFYFQNFTNDIRIDWLLYLIFSSHFISSSLLFFLQS